MSSDLRFSFSRGCIVLKGQIINNLAHKWINLVPKTNEIIEAINGQYQRDGVDDYHITIMIPSEVKLLSTTTTISLDEWNEQYIPNLHLYDLGIGKYSTSYYIILYAPRLQKLRSQYNLSPIDLHITIGLIHADYHNNNIRKDIHTLYYSYKDSTVTDTADISSAAAAAEMYYQTIECILYGPANPTVRLYLHYNYLIQQLISNGYISGTYYYCKELMKNDKSLGVQQQVYEIFEEIISRPSACLKLFNENENYGELITKILNSNIKYVTLGSHKVRRYYSSSIQKNPSGGKGEYYHITYINFPRNFSLVSDSIYGSSLPTTMQQLVAWKEMGITNILTIMEDPLPEELRQYPEINFHHYAVPDKHPPTLDQIRSIMTLLGSLLHPSHTQSTKKQVLIHCLGGVGRTATVLCCYLMRYQQMSRESAMNHLLSTRKTIITSQQEEILQQYYQEVLVSSVPLTEAALTVSTVPCEPTVTFPSLIMCIGYPGSGKSTFSETLLKAFPDLFIRINQDDLGREKSQQLMSRTHYSSSDSTTSKPLVKILDRCNLRQEERLEWMNLHCKGSKSNRNHRNNSVWYIHFNISLEECQWRLSRRTNHPTIKSSQSAQRILSTMKDTLELPLQSIENYQKLYTLSSIEEVNQLLLEWGVASSLLPGEEEGDNHDDTSSGNDKIIKFPRTRHVYNLGSATRDDLILTNDDVLTQFGHGKLLYIEEKIDGANLGISIQNNRIIVQNRSHYVSSAYHPQFKYLDQWILEHSNELWEILQYSERYILYGEWVYARHSIHYTKLPDYFLAFDYYDKLTKQFYSYQRFQQLLSTTTATSISKIRLIKCQNFTNKEDLIELVHSKSIYYDGYVEGIYIRTMTEDNQWVLDRGKIVRSDFMAGNEFWSKGGIQPNLIDYQLKHS